MTDNEKPPVNYRLLRPIQFRGKRKSDGAWVYGAYYHRRFWNGAYEVDTHYIITCGAMGGDEFHEIDPMTRGQFTGETDNTRWEDLTTEEQAEFALGEEKWRGKLMWEGDRLKFRDGMIGVIKWLGYHTAGFSAYCTPQETRSIHFNYYGNGPKVTGTVYDEVSTKVAPDPETQETKITT